MWLIIFKFKRLKDYNFSNITLKRANKKVWQSGYITNLTTVKKIGDTYKVSTMKIPIKQPGFDSKHSKKCSVNNNKLDNNLIRAKTKIREYALCNEFEYFVTLTLDKEKYDRYNLKKYIKDLAQFIRDERKRTGLDLQYILIPETHKDGAWHLHGLFMNVNINDLQLFDEIASAPGKLKGKGYYNYERYQKKFGFCSLGKIKDKNKCANYIVKYVNKTLGENLEMNCKSYYNSRGLKKPTVIKKGLLSSPLEYEFVNEYCSITHLTNIDDLIINEF